jgi:EAL domain-containing protein (putative c-di-GMP-specific phosphodiesterase class I)/GGDEF domain-containing protein
MPWRLMLIIRVYMDYSRFNFTQVLNKTILVLSLFIFPSYAQAASFSFTEFNIAFVLGLSIPLILIIALAKPIKNIRLRYPVLISVCVLLMLYAMAYLTQYQEPFLLSAAITFSCILYFWLKSTYLSPKARINYLVNFIVIATTVSFIVNLWFFTAIDAYLSWLAASAIILIATALTVFSSKKHDKSNTLRLTLHWFIHLFFILTLFAWLNAYVIPKVLVSAIVVSYLAALVNGCWYLVQAIHLEIGHKIAGDQQKDMATILRDPATNLPNYQHALVQFEAAIKTQTESRYVAIAFKPVNFQQVNEVLGHHNSDILLLQLAYCLQKKVTENQHLINFGDVEHPVRIARLQGLHFLVVLDLSLNEHPEQSNIEQLCRELMEAVPSAMSFKSFSLNFELAFGAAHYGEYSHSISETIAFAEDALLVAEKNQQVLSYFDHTNTLYTEKQLRRMEHLKRDIIDENLQWYIQPQICLSNKEVLGFQVQVHWYNGNEAPEEYWQFIDVAAYSGDLYALTKQMIEQAFLVLKKLQQLSFYKPVTIKLTNKESLEPALVDYIASQVKSSGVSPKYLMVEFSENIILAASQKAKYIIDQLKSMDITIAIGEFSGSYESLRYLRKVSINQVKIDCSLLSQNDDGSPDKAIINALINLTRAMKLPLVGTSIDNMNIEQVFSAIGGEFAQGRYLSKGVVYDEIELWISRWLAQYPHSEKTPSNNSPQG